MRVLEAGYVLPAYDWVLKCSHVFNLLDARGSDQRHGTDRLHRPRPPIGTALRRELPGVPGAARLSAPRQSGARRWRPDEKGVASSRDRNGGVPGPLCRAGPRGARARIAEERTRRVQVGARQCPHIWHAPPTHCADRRRRCHDRGTRGGGEGSPARVAFDERRPDAGRPRLSRRTKGSASKRWSSRDRTAARTSSPSASGAGQARSSRCFPTCWQRRSSPLSFPKSMRWGDGTRAIRPAHSLARRARRCREVIRFDIEDVTAGRDVSRGHRVLADQPIELPQAPRRYVERDGAEEGRVLVDPTERKAASAGKSRGCGRSSRWGAHGRRGAPRRGDAPGRVAHGAAAAALIRAYLEVPSEILVTTMKEHQKYFPVRAPRAAPARLHRRAQRRR